MRHCVVIPAHNAARYLEACVRSVLPQLGAADEVIIVDDGSDDATREIAEGLGDGRVIVASHPTNRGAAAARNTGLSIASGDVVDFLDADDLWAEGRMAAVRRLIEENPQCSAFSGWVAHFHCTLFPPARLTDLPLPRAATLPGSVVLLRGLIEAVGPLDTRLSSGEFIDYVARLREATARWIESNEVWYHRRIHAANHSRADKSRTAAYLDVVRRNLNRREQP
jgi:glycosyltransferase involved in cell wall biosynthesis